MNPHAPAEAMGTSSAPLYDTHAHLDFPDFSGDVGQVLDRAAASGISRIFTISTDLESSGRALALAQKHPSISAVVGCHPGHAMEAPDEIRAALRTLAAAPEVVAIGETGLDFYRLPSSKGGSAAEDAAYKAKQMSLFEQQLEVAAGLGLNCVIHTRDSMSETLEVFRPYASRLRGVFHCFVGTRKDLESVLELGSLVSFTGIVTFKGAAAVMEAATAVPLDAFMVETDAPFLAPVPFRGKRCEPSHVRLTAEKIAALRGCSIEVISEATCRTADAFFKRRPVA